ncbi:uncharacterized protein LOC120398755 isoform X2 [Mauremys reevesii]|uniref:uncharacterized protein LOC120398755 isoform X2 n=1 Tax=Mauremys reevesii TaxID=260615 RepID=UPI00193FBA17|nr:uncharacterized protein LOC120398755 isoform X2 [Mauremys reevesii]
MFLHAIHPVCLTAQQRWQDTLEPHCCKATVMERIVHHETCPGVIAGDTPPVSCPACCLHPGHREGHITQVQALHKVMPELLDAMLGNLLAESPETDRLHYIFEHINYWIVSRVLQERARATRSSTALLRFTITLPVFDNSAEFPRLGHYVAHLALFISDPGEDLSRQAREGVYWLYQLLLHQRGLTIHETKDLAPGQLAPGLQEHGQCAGGLWQVLLTGAEKILPLDGGQCWPSTISYCVSARLGCSSPTPSWWKPRGQAGGCHSQRDVPAPHYPALAPGAWGAARAVPHLMPLKVSHPYSATPAPCCRLP